MSEPSSQVPAPIEHVHFPPQPPRERLTALDMEWLEGSGEHAEVVISCRIRLARNLARYRFPHAAAPGELNAVLGSVLRSLRSRETLPGFEAVDLARVHPLDLHVMIEKHLLSPMHVQMVLEGGTGRALLLGPRGTVSAMVNEEDHLRLQILLPGLELEQGWQRISELDDALEERLDFAWSESLGFLSACPSNVGTGLRASVMLHLPALALAGALDTIKAQIAGHIGLAVRGMFGEGSGMQGNLLQISNQISLGPSEDDLIDRVRGVALRIIEQELLMRQALRREHATRLADRVWRAVGLLRHARLLSAAEALQELSMLRLGVEVGLLPPVPRPILNTWLVGVCPANVQRAAQHEAEAASTATTEEVTTADALRAQMMRQALADLAI